MQSLNLHGKHYLEVELEESRFAASPTDLGTAPQAAYVLFHLHDSQPDDRTEIK